MARLAIRQLRYDGDKYEFSSPIFPDGIIVLEGENGTGKSTFSNLIYFCLGGTVAAFKRDGRSKHTEVTSDSNNFVELTIQIATDTFKIKRLIGTNDVAVFSEKETIGVFPVFRSKDNKYIFSDWLLETLGIDGFTLHFSRHKGKINFTDLLRLIYYDQTQDPEKVYKQADNDNGYVSDSQVFRKAIFEILIGQTFTTYYAALDELTSIEKTLSETKGSIDAFATAVVRFGKSEDWNTIKITEELRAVESQLQKLMGLRTALRSQGDSGDTSSVLSDLRSKLETVQISQTDSQVKMNDLLAELRSLQELKRNLIVEVTQIKKILFTHEQLNLFSPDTCPYCLNVIGRPHGNCICGTSVDESQYERFFYSSAEYMNILKSKQRNVETVAKAIKDCEENVVYVNKDLADLRDENIKIQKNITSAVGSKASKIDFSKLDEIDNKIIELRSTEETLVKQLALEEERQKMEDKLSSLESAKSAKSAIVDKLDAESRSQMTGTLQKFNEKYSALMQDTIANCRRARIDDSYMPVINDGDYVESSAVVPKRLMYFLTLLSLSTDDPKINFPRFLLIDTPDTAGIDDPNLKRAISKIPEVIGKDKLNDCQVILTTGLNMYPDNLKSSVLIKLSKQDRLLKEKKTVAVKT